MTTQEAPRVVPRDRDFFRAPRRFRGHPRGSLEPALGGDPEVAAGAARFAPQTGYPPEKGAYPLH
jgi:hypothetical protein